MHLGLTGRYFTAVTTEVTIQDVGRGNTQTA